MQYDKEILRVLIEAGCEGLSVQKISRHVHNACNSLFNPLSQSDIHKYVQQFLLRNCKTDTSLVEKTKKGIYRLNVNNGMTQQLFLQFREDRETVEEAPEKDYSLDLFGNLNQPKETESAENFEFENPTNEFLKKNDDVLVIDKNLKGLDFSLAKCCHPIYGDPVFGFVTVNGGIKIHRTDCPNAPEMRKRFGYRIVKARWSGKGSSQYAITLRVIGNDDIGIVSNITNVISKDEKIVMRSINIDSHDGLFSGNLVVLLDDNSKLNMLIKKLRTVKGVKQVTRV